MFGLYRGVLCGSTLAMVAMSWPLWVDGPDFPRIPFVAGMPEPPVWASWLVAGGIALTLGLAAVGMAWRLMLRIGLVLFGLAILRDQDRFQPWAYQFAVIGLALAGVSKHRALGMARWYVVGLYAYSGLSKLDASFCREMGPTFLSAALGPFGVSTASWPEPARALACLAMPAVEVAVATLLAVPSARRIGLVGSIAQHLALLMILGPWNMGHSPTVLAWNVALILENLALFGRSTIPVDGGRDGRFGRTVRVAFWSAMVLPSVERLGLCDAWPGHALYASHCERAEVYLHGDDLGRFPEAVRRRLGPSDLGPWRRLDATAWSRDVRGTPLYPSGRVGNALAEYLEARPGGEQPVRLVQWGRAGARDGSRDRDESLGLAAIRRRAGRFLLNARPVFRQEAR